MLAADPPDLEGACETARRTIRDANRASDVIGRCAISSPGRRSRRKRWTLNEAAAEVIALSMSELQRHRVILRPELADDLPLVTANRVQLQQVILNLLRNAADAMAAWTMVRGNSSSEPNVTEAIVLRLTVQDVGVGLEPHVIDKLFQAFYTTKSSGMGIGLSVSVRSSKSMAVVCGANRMTVPAPPLPFPFPEFRSLHSSYGEARGTGTRRADRHAAQPCLRLLSRSSAWKRSRQRRRR